MYYSCVEEVVHHIPTVGLITPLVSREPFIIHPEIIKVYRPSVVAFGMVESVKNIAMIGHNPDIEALRYRL